MKKRVWGQRAGGLLAQPMFLKEIPAQRKCLANRLRGTCHGMSLRHLILQVGASHGVTLPGINKKAGYLVPGLFHVAEGDEISNLDLIRDIDRIIKQVEVLNILK